MESYLVALAKDGGAEGITQLFLYPAGVSYYLVVLFNGYGNNSMHNYRRNHGLRDNDSISAWDKVLHAWIKMKIILYSIPNAPHFQVLVKYNRKHRLINVIRQLDTNLLISSRAEVELLSCQTIISSNGYTQNCYHIHI